MSDTGSIGLARLNAMRQPTEKEVQREITKTMRDVLGDVRRQHRFGMPGAGSSTVPQVKGFGWREATPLRSPYEGEHARLVLDAIADRFCGPVQLVPTPPKSRAAAAEAEAVAEPVAQAAPKAEMETQSEPATRKVVTRRRTI